MPEKRLMFAMLKSAIKEYLAVPKCRWRDHLTMIYELPRKNNKRTRLMGELLNSRRAYRWLHSISNEPFSYRWIASELSLPWSLPALVDSLVIDAVKRYANHSPNDLLIEFDEIEPDMPEKRLMFAFTLETP